MCSEKCASRRAYFTTAKYINIGWAYGVRHWLDTSPESLQSNGDRSNSKINVCILCVRECGSGHSLSAQYPIIWKVFLASERAASVYQQNHISNFRVFSHVRSVRSNVVVVRAWLPMLLVAQMCLLCASEINKQDLWLSVARRSIETKVTYRMLQRWRKPLTMWTIAAIQG